MDIKLKIDKLEQRALDVVANAKNEADAVIEISADSGHEAYDFAAILIAEAEAKALEYREQAEELAQTLIDAVEDQINEVEESVEEFVEESKSFFKKNKLWLGIVGAVVVLVVIGLVILI